MNYYELQIETAGPGVELVENELTELGITQFVVDDPRVSRLHARVETRNGSCVLVDVSTYGTWVRFHGPTGTGAEIALRREECVLHGSGEIGLGAPLSDISAPTISFDTTASGLLLGRRDAR